MEKIDDAQMKQFMEGSGSPYECVIVTTRTCAICAAVLPEIERRADEAVADMKAVMYMFTGNNGTAELFYKAGIMSVPAVLFRDGSGKLQVIQLSGPDDIDRVPAGLLF